MTVADQPLAGKTALVTGSSKGIGAATALALAALVVLFYVLIGGPIAALGTLNLGAELENRVIRNTFDPYVNKGMFKDGYGMGIMFGAEYTDTKTALAPGKIVSAGKAGIEVACGGGQTLRITEIQAAGKKRMSAAAFLLGHPMKADG